MIIQMQQGRQVFAQLVSRVSRLSLFYQILQYQETRLQLKAFRLEKLLPDRALQTYDRLLAKHQHQADFHPHPDAWYESEKRLFAWFMAFHSYLERDGQSIKSEPDFATLSSVFFLKDADFLEFHWLVLVKSTEKAGWEESQEEMLMTAIRQYGLRWNEVSRSLFTQTNKTFFRSPKTCRQRWLNHLDHSKVKGNWTVEEDVAIFSYVVEEGKRWSRIVAVLGDRRTEHTIKNRFNAVIARNRRYKFEKDVKVAARILEHLRLRAASQDSNRLEEDANGRADSGERFKEENVSSEEKEEEKVQHKMEAMPEKEEEIKVQVCAEAEQVRQSYQDQQVAVKDEGLNAENLVYPFQNYSYELQVFNQVCAFQQNQMLYYQQFMTLPPAPTADTVSREARVIEQRRRRREVKREE